jgi:hypothetical protein
MSYAPRFDALRAPANPNRGGRAFAGFVLHRSIRGALRVEFDWKSSWHRLRRYLTRSSLADRDLFFQ